MTGRSVYELEGSLAGRVLWIVGPGPSAARWEEHSAAIEARGGAVVAINSAVEFTRPTFWLWSDKSFGWLYSKEIHADARGGRCPPVMVCPWHQRKMEQRYRGEALYFFDCQMKLRPWEELVGSGRVADRPFWYSPTRKFLPGRASVANVAVSFAWLLGPRVCVLAGVDWEVVDGVYYREGVRKNRGPTDRERALRAGLNFFRLGMSLRIWDGLDMRTVSPSLAREGVALVSWEEALTL